MNKSQFVDLLNQDLANEYAAVIQYTTYAAQLTGPYRGQLVSFMQAEIPEELQHAQFLADKITMLGGIPTTVPAVVPSAFGNKAMLEAILEAETRAASSYTERSKQAEALGLIALSIDLEDMVRDESNHMEETVKLLKDWPLG